MDSDDYLVADAIKILIEYINKDSSIDLFYCNNLEVYPSSKIKKSTYSHFPSNDQFLHAILTYPRIPFKHSGVTFKKDRVLNIGGYNDQLSSKVDIELMARILKMDFNVGFIPEPLVKFNFHRNSISRNKRLKGLPIWWEIIERYGPNRYS